MAVTAGAVLALPLAWKLGDPVSMNSQSYLLKAVLLPAAGILALLVPMIGLSARRLALPALLGFSVAVGLWTNLEQTGTHTTSVSWTEYGETGFRETLAFLERHASGTVPVIRKDLAYALLRDRPDRTLDWVYTVVLRRNLADPEVAREVEKTLLRNEVVWLVIDPYCSGAASSELLSAHFEPEQRFGDFLIFKRRTPNGPTSSPLS